MLLVVSKSQDCLDQEGRTSPHPRWRVQALGECGWEVVWHRAVEEKELQTLPFVCFYRWYEAEKNQIWGSGSQEQPGMERVEGSS